MVGKVGRKNRRKKTHITSFQRPRNSEMCSASTFLSLHTYTSLITNIINYLWSIVIFAKLSLNSRSLLFSVSYSLCLFSVITSQINYLLERYFSFNCAPVNFPDSSRAGLALCLSFIIFLASPLVSAVTQTRLHCRRRRTRGIRGSNRMSRESDVVNSEHLRRRIKGTTRRLLPAIWECFVTPTLSNCL